MTNISNGPPVTQPPAWEYIVNNAYRTADQYATENNPSATFICTEKSYQFVEQLAGEHEGNYLLLIVNEHAGDTSFAALLANFDVNAQASDLDDEDPNLWKVVNAKFNGIEF